MSGHWFEYEKGKRMNDSIFDIQNMRKSVLNCTQNLRVEDDTDRLFVKSLCGFMGVLSDFEMLYLGRKFKLMDDETLAVNLDMVKARIASMFADPCPADDTLAAGNGPADGSTDDTPAAKTVLSRNPDFDVVVCADLGKPSAKDVSVSAEDLKDALSMISKYLGKKGIGDAQGC